jgi:uncharacterized protein (TIGR02594 family)
MTDEIDTPAWLSLAFSERGVRRFGPGESNPRIVEYNAHTNLVGYDDKISWCSSFLNWCLANTGQRGTGSALARSWLEWGRALFMVASSSCPVTIPLAGKGTPVFIFATTPKPFIFWAAISLEKYASSTIR